MNYSRMQSTYPQLQRQMKEDAQQKTRKRQGKGISIVMLTNNDNWFPSKALMQQPFIVTRQRHQARVITCFLCGKPGHMQKDCPENPENPKSPLHQPEETPV